MCLVSSHICVEMYIDMCICVFMCNQYICMYIWKHVHIFRTFMSCASIHLYLCKCNHIFHNTHIQIHVHWHAYRHTHTHTYAHIHTRTRTPHTHTHTNQNVCTVCVWVCFVSPQPWPTICSTRSLGKISSKGASLKMLVDTCSAKICGRSEVGNRVMGRYLRSH